MRCSLPVLLNSNYLFIFKIQNTAVGIFFKCDIEVEEFAVSCYFFLLFIGIAVPVVFESMVNVEAPAFSGGCREGHGGQQAQDHCKGA